MPPGYDDSSPVASCSSCSLHVALPAVWWSHTASIVWRSCETASPNLNGETLVMTVDTLGRKMWKTHGETLGNDLQMMDENQIYVSWGEGTTWFGLWTFMMSSFVLFFHNPQKKQLGTQPPVNHPKLEVHDWVFHMSHVIVSFRITVSFRHWFSATGHWSICKTDCDRQCSIGCFFSTPWWLNIVMGNGPSAYISFVPYILNITRSYSR